jgi:hypothetical protein
VDPDPESDPESLIKTFLMNIIQQINIQLLLLFGSGDAQAIAINALRSGEPGGWGGVTEAVGWDNGAWLLMTGRRDASPSARWSAESVCLDFGRCPWTLILWLTEDREEFTALKSKNLWKIKLKKEINCLTCDIGVLRMSLPEKPCHNLVLNTPQTCS